MEAPQFGRLTAVLDLDALRANLAVVRDQVPPNTEVTASLKANAYGHGVQAIGGCLVDQGVRWLAVGNPAQALELRSVGISCGIWLFPPVPRHGVSSLLEADVTFSVESYLDAAFLARHATEAPARVFLKVDSGLGRLGVPVDEAESEAEKIINGLSSVALEGVFTHLPFAEPAAIPWITSRTKEFCDAAKSIRDLASGPLLIQSNASAGIVGGIDASETNAVCTGQLLLGLEPEALVTAGWPGTRRVMRSLQSTIRSIRTLEPATELWPDGTRMVEQPTRRGLIPSGYGDSPLQEKSGQSLWIRGYRVPVIGLSLEHAQVDLTEVPEATDGDIVHLFSDDPSEAPPLEAFASMQGRSRLEALVSLPSTTTVHIVDGEVAH